MEPHVVTVVPEMTVRELVQTFLEEQVRGAPVLGPSGKVVGMVSEADVLRQFVTRRSEAPGENGSASHLIAPPSPRNPDQMQVREIMGPIGRVFGPDDEMSALLRFFASEGPQRAVVIDNDILLGIITPSDLVRALGPTH
jgi:CBS domain-containing protein